MGERENVTAVDCRREAAIGPKIEQRRAQWLLLQSLLTLSPYWVPSLMITENTVAAEVSLALNDVQIVN